MPTENLIIGDNTSREIDSEGTEYVWTESIERILDKMRINCVNLSEYHMFKYRRYKRYLMFFRIPIIVLSGANVFTSVGLQSYISQPSISIINSISSLICGIITSVELFLNIQKKMETDLVSHKDYYRLSIDIFKVISLERSIRKVDGKTFLDQKFSEYEKLIKGSNVFDSEYIFDTISSQFPVVPSITQFMDNEQKELDNNMFKIAKSFGNKVCNIPSYLVPHSRQKKREKYIKTHRDSTRSYFYKDIEIIAKMETDKANEIAFKRDQINNQKKLASIAAIQAAAHAKASVALKPTSKNTINLNSSIEEEENVKLDILEEK